MKRILFLGLFSSIAFGQTILDADLVSRIGANRNYVKNPDAFFNTANVTGAVTRSITTPISENGKTEFNITNMASNSRVSWSANSVTQGLEGRTCEASFVYRGAALGSKIIARINNIDSFQANLLNTSGVNNSYAVVFFPCPTSATPVSLDILNGPSGLTGTIEISGVYFGKSKTSSDETIAPENQNFFAASELTVGADIVRSTIGTTAPATGVSSYVNSGRAIAVTTPGEVAFKVQNVPSGKYFLKFNSVNYAFSQGGSSVVCFLDITDGTTTKRISRTQVTTVNAIDTNTNTEVEWDIAAAGTKEWKINLVYDSGTGSGQCAIGNVNKISFSIRPANSAFVTPVFIQGPVKAAGTGTALQANEVNSVQVFTLATNTLFGPTGALTNLVNTVPSPGIYDVECKIKADYVTSFTPFTNNYLQVCFSKTGPTGCEETNYQPQMGVANPGNMGLISTRAYSVSANGSETFYCGGAVNYAANVGGRYTAGSDTKLVLIKRN